MDNYRKKLKKIIDNFGFEVALEMLPLSPIELLNDSKYPLNSDILESYIIDSILKTLIKSNNKYKECNLGYTPHGSLIWSCNFSENGYIYEIGAYATPYYEDYTIPFETYYCEKHNKYDMSEENSTEEEFYTTIPAPKSFRNIDSFNEWFTNEYLPLIYKLILNSLEKYKKILNK